MPLSRYQIRSEYSLADPELYRAAEKDDPEALLDGVAMAGLVGVLRQLGDLAEFAAELFHDLHEEVMVTATRGHSLIVRVQQLEAEIPAVEKAFLSQTSHSSFLYNPGIVWHPKTRMEKNPIMSGDLPRFIMDSYEECRGPPRLFLLDKFDVAGAGACLKRYTDPSFFKLETSSSGDVQRERKIRKAKKKGSRWRNGETPEVLSMSHAKLHQLFLEERIENGITDPARRVKLRKRLNGFPFDTKSGKSYMERFLKSASADHNEVHDIPVDSSPLLLPPNGKYEAVSEIDKIKTMTHEKMSKERFTSPSSVKKGTYEVDLPIEKLSEIASGTGLSYAVTSDSGLQTYNVGDPRFEAYKVPSTTQNGNSEKVFPLDGCSSESVGDYKSDDFASEVEQYMDALTTIESEIDTDTEFKAKRQLGYFNSRSHISDVDVDVNDDRIQALSSESQSLGNSSLSDDGISSLKKGIFIVSSSDTQSPSAPSDGEVSSIVYPCDHKLEVHDTTSVVHFSVAVKSTVSQAPGGAVSDDESTGISEYPCLSSKLDNLGSDSVPLDLIAFHKKTDSLETGKAPVGPESDKTFANLSLNTVPTNTSQPPAIHDPHSRVRFYNHLIDGFEVENHETGRNCPCCPSNSKDESSFKERSLDGYGKMMDSDYQMLNENVASLSCFLANPADATNESALTHTDENEMNELDGQDLKLSLKASLQSNISDVALKSKEDLSPDMSGRNTPVVEFASLRTNSCVDIVTDKSYGQSLNCMLEARSAEDHHGHKLDDSQLGQQRAVIPFTEEHHLDPVVTDKSYGQSLNCMLEASAEDHHGHKLDDSHLGQQRAVIPFTEEHHLDPVTAGVDNNCPSTGEITLNATSKTNKESAVCVVQKVVTNLQPEQLKGTADREEEYLARPSIMKMVANSDLDLLELNCTSSPSFVGEIFALSVPDSGTEGESVETTLGATAKTDISSELVYNDPEIVTDVPFLQSKQEILGSGKEHIEKPLDTEIAAFQQGEGCNFEHVEVNSLSISSLLRDDVKVHLEVSSAGTQREGNEDADGSLVDQKNSVEVSFPAFENEYIGPEAEKASPLDEPLILCVTNNLYHKRLDLPDSISALCDVDGCSMSDRERSDNMHSDNISVRSPAEGGEWKASSGEENADSLPQQLDEIVPSKVMELTQTQMQGSEETEHVARTDASSEPLIESGSSQPLPPEFISQEINDFDVPGTMDISKATNSFSLPGTSHATVEEMPPLPPLPPVQWRITKLQHALSDEGNYSGQDNANDFPPLFESRDGQDSHLLNAVMVQSNSGSERSSHVSGHTTEEVVHSCQSLRRMTPVPDHGDSKEEDEATLAFVPHVPALRASENPYGELAESRNQTASRASSAVDELRQRLECTTSQQCSMTEKDQPQHAMLTTSVHIKLPRPRNPLIDDVIAVDKSKLRKVTEHASSEPEKVDPLLEQIRTKSYNLKPAVASKASIPTPATNLKVAAILDKVKTIRQACVGSDEDDDNDSWSD